MWNFVKSYAETSEFMMQNGTNFHKQLWLRASGALSMLDNNRGYYDTIKKMNVDYPTPDIRQIEKDVIRSYQDLTDKHA